MAEPFTISLIGLASFLGNMLSKGATSVLGEKVGGFVRGEVLARSAGYFGMATNNEAEKSIRRAQMASLKCLVNAYSSIVSAKEEAEQFPFLFIEAALNFADVATAHCDKDDLERKVDVIEEVARSLDSALAPVPEGRLAERAARLRQAAERAVFDELEMEVGKVVDKTRRVFVPNGFRDVFFNGREKTDEEDEIVNWFDGFMLFAAKELKGSDEKFKVMYETTSLARINQLAFDTNEIALLTQTTVTTIAASLTDNAARIERLDRLLTQSVKVLGQISEKLKGLEEGQWRIKENIAEISSTIARLLGRDVEIRSLAIRWIIELIAAVFVDEMRMLCVGTSAIARRANAERYSEFVGMTEQHLNDFNNQRLLYIGYLEKGFISKIRPIEQCHISVFTQLKSGPCSSVKGGRSFKKMQRTAEQIHDLCSTAQISGYDTTSKMIAEIGKEVWDSFGRPRGSGSLDELFRVRLTIQSIFLSRVQEGAPSPILTIADDMYQSFALAYFIVDRWLMCNGSPEQ